jgi:hypothetical protein
MRNWLYNVTIINLLFHSLPIKRNSLEELRIELTMYNAALYSLISATSLMGLGLGLIFLLNYYIRI